MAETTAIQEGSVSGKVKLLSTMKYRCPFENFELTSANIGGEECPLGITDGNVVSREWSSYTLRQVPAHC